MCPLVPSSLLPRIFAVMLGALLALVGLLWLMLQGALSTSIFSNGMQSSGPSIAALVRAVDAPDANVEPPITVFSSSLRAARVDGAFPQRAEPDPVLMSVLADAAPDLFTERVVRFHVGRPIGTPGDPRPLSAGIAEIVLEVDVALQGARVLRIAFAPGARSHQPREALFWVGVCSGRGFGRDRPARLLASRPIGAGC